MLKLYHILLALTSLVLAAVGVTGCDTGGGADESNLPEGMLLFVALDTTVSDGWRSLRVYKADLRTGRTASLSSPDDPGDDRGPALDAVWSPDGRRVVYQEAVGFDAGHLTVMNADGSGKRTLSDPWEHRASPVWGPDDRTVLYEQRVYAGVPVGLFALDVETAPSSDPVCVLCDPDGPFGADPFVTEGDTLVAVAIAPGSEPGTVVLVSPVSRGPRVGDYDVHLYLVDFRARRVLRRLTTQPLRGHRFAVARGGEAVAMMRLNAPLSESGPTPSALYVTPSLDQAPVRVAGFERGGFGGFRWANDRRHIVLRREVLDGEGYATGDHTVSVIDARDPESGPISLDWAPPSIAAVPDLYVH